MSEPLLKMGIVVYRSTTHKKQNLDPGFNDNIENMVQNNRDTKVNYVASSIDNPYLSYGDL